MNWLTLAVLGVVAGWFEFSYQKSRRGKKPTGAPDQSAAAAAVRVEDPAMQPSVAPGSEVDKKLGTPA